MQINGMNGLEAIRVAVEYETKQKKCMIAIFAIVNWVIFTAVGGAFLSYMINSNDLQKEFDDITASYDSKPNGSGVVYYDVGFLIAN